LELSEVIDRVLQDIRQLTFELSPPVLYELGLEAALEWLAEQFQSKYGLSIRFHDDEAPKPLENVLRVLIFQASRELLFNVVKHAKAKRIDVTIHRNDNALHLSIEDDGVGFDAMTVNSTNYKNNGFGLFSIRERLQHIGGSLEVHSAVNAGTRVVLVMPLDDHAREKAKVAT
jgi:signal transduction histidine kinase